MKLEQQAVISSSAALLEIELKCQELADTAPENTQKIAADLLAMGKGYYHDACARARKSFNVALGAAIVGTLFFFAASAFVMGRRAEASTFAAVGGTITEGLSALVFMLHFRAVKQFAYFHVCLERMTRFMVANSVCTNIESGEKRDETRSSLVRAMLDAPMLPLPDMTEAAKLGLKRKAKSAAA